MGSGSAVVRIWISSRKGLGVFPTFHTTFSLFRGDSSVLSTSTTVKAVGAMTFSTLKGVALESVNSSEVCVPGTAVSYRRRSGWAITGGTTLAVTGRISVRSFGNATVSSDEKFPLSVRGPSLMVMRKGSDVISHVSFGWLDGKRRISDVLSGAFTVSVIVFSCFVSGRMSPNSQTLGVRVAKRLAVAMIAKETLGVLGLSVKMVTVAEVSSAGRISGLMVMWNVPSASGGIASGAVTSA